MIALLLAASLVDPASAAVARDMPAEAVSAKSAPHVVFTDRAYATQRAYRACTQNGPQLATTLQLPMAKAMTLNKLPKANHEIAVNRMVNGCPAPVVVSYSVGK